MGNLELVYNSNFELNSAKLEEWYTLCRKGKSWRGKPKLTPIYQYHPEGMRRPITGDLKWAKKIAQHYNIDLPTPNQEQRARLHE